MNSAWARWAAGMALVSAAALPPPSWAGTFTVTPVRIYMTARDRAVAVTVVNDGDSEIVLQAEVSNWSQSADGTDILAPTEDLILAPPILRLAPKARQVVRLALLTPADMSRQLTYRVLMREIPEALPDGKTSGLRTPIALALSLPVFITPPSAKRDVECTVASSSEAALHLSCRNNGNAYAQLREATITRGEQVAARFQGGVYILPGATKAIALRREVGVQGGAGKLSLGFDDGQSTVPIALP